MDTFFEKLRNIRRYILPNLSITFEGENVTDFLKKTKII